MGGIFRVSKSAWNGLKLMSSTCLNPKTNVCLDPTLTVCFQYYRLGPECMVRGGHLPGVLIGLEWPEIAVRYGSQPKDQCLPGPHLDCLFSILSAWKGLKSLSGTGLNPKTNVFLDPTLTVCFQYYRLGPECMVHGGHLPGV